MAELTIEQHSAIDEAEALVQEMVEKLGLDDATVSHMADLVEDGKVSSTKDLRGRFTEAYLRAMNQTTVN